MQFNRKSFFNGVKDRFDPTLNDLGTRVAVVEQHIESFSPVKKLVFAVVGIIVTALVMAVLALVLQPK